MRIGVIGVGRIGSAHAQVVRDHPGVERTVVADADVARAAEVADRLGVVRADSVDALLGQVDAVVVAATTSEHAGLVSAAVGRGLPVFCEKPVATDIAETVKVRDEVRASGVPVQIGFQRRFDAGYTAAREALRAGRLGGLRRAHLLTCDPQPPPADYIPRSGGLFRDCNVHDFDVLRWVTGREVVSVWATGVTRGAAVFAESGDVDEAVAALTMDDGTLATVHGSRYNGAGYDVRMELAGTEGTWAVGLDDHSALTSAEAGTTFPAGDPWPAFWPRFAAAYAAELTAFVEVAAGSRESPCTVDDALEAFCVAEAATRSRLERREVRLDEVRP